MWASGIQYYINLSETAVTGERRSFKSAKQFNVQGSKFKEPTKFQPFQRSNAFGAQDAAHFDFHHESRLPFAHADTFTFSQLRKRETIGSKLEMVARKQRNITPVILQRDCGNG